MADAETTKPLEAKKEMHILKVVLLSKNAKFLLQAIALQLRSQRKSLITQSVKICKIHSEWFDFFFSSKCFEAGNSE